MQTKIFLFSLLATFLALGVTATPARAKARDLRTNHARDDKPVDFSTVATSLGDVKPPPKGKVITPGDKDVPAPSTSVGARDLESLEKRAAGCIYVTDDGNFAGHSAHVCIDTKGDCTAWSNSWRYTISSFGPDQGTLCRIYTDPNCGGLASDTFGYPGYKDLGKWNDNMGSFRCWW